MADRGGKAVFALLLFLPLLVPLSLSAQPPGGTGRKADIGAIVKRVVRAYGGREAIEGVRALHASGRTKAFMKRQEGTYELYLKRERKLRVVTKYPGSSEIRVLNGAVGFRGEREGELVAVDGAKHLSMLFHYKHLDLPYGLMKGLYHIEHHGQAKLGGKDVDVLVLIDEDGPPMKAYVGGNGLIVKVMGFFEVSGTMTDLSVELSDFRKVGGTVLPHKFMNSGGGVAIGETVIDKYEINPDIPDSVFADSPAPAGR